MKPKKCPHCHQNKDYSEFYKDKSRSSGHSWLCKDCTRSKSNKNYNNNKDSILLKSKEYREKNSEIIKIKRHNRYMKNRDKYLSEMKKYRSENLVSRKEYDKKYRAVNKNKIRMSRNLFMKTPEGRALGSVTIRRHTLGKLNRVPKKTTDQELVAIKNLYLKANILTDKTGILHEVDHIIPIKSKEVSGLHVLNNLQILTTAANRFKSNKNDGTVDNKTWIKKYRKKLNKGS